MIHLNPAWWHMPLTLILRSFRQVNLEELEASLIYIVSPRKPDTHKHKHR